MEPMQGQGDPTGQAGQSTQFRIPALRLFHLTRAVPPEAYDAPIGYETLDIYAHEINLLGENLIAFQEYAYDAARGGIALFTRRVINGYIDVQEEILPVASRLVN